MTLRVLIIDDEEHARRRLALMLRQIPMAEVVGAAKSGAEALELIRTHAPEVLLLDVAMPEMSGFDLLPLLDADFAPIVIFVTAFHQHAVRAFDWSAADYLLKPVAFDRLETALDRAAAALRARDADSRLQELQAVLAAVRSGEGDVPAPAYESEIWVQRRVGFLRVTVDSIRWIQAERDYIRLHAPPDIFLMRETLTDFNARLDPALFLRVHRSFVVRRSQIAEVRRAANGLMTLVLADGAACPVGRKYADQVRSLLR